MKDAFDIIKTVRLTEKGTILGEKFNQYVLEVAPTANKIEIKIAVEKLFGKKVLRVNTMNASGKKKRERTPNFGRTNHYKKAIVSLKEGDKIEVI